MNPNPLNPKHLFGTNPMPCGKGPCQEQLELQRAGLIRRRVQKQTGEAIFLRDNGKYNGSYKNDYIGIYRDITQMMEN